MTQYKRLQRTKSVTRALSKTKNVLRIKSKLLSPPIPGSSLRLPSAPKIPDSCLHTQATQQELYVFPFFWLFVVCSVDNGKENKFVKSVIFDKSLSAAHRNPT